MDKKSPARFVEFRNVRKVYKMGEVSIEALHDVNFTIEKGEICVIVGPSGAGKTTLLNILGGMDRLTSGQVLLDGAEVSAFSKRELASYRRYDVGFVFQFYNLIQNLTAIENVELATQICREPLDPMAVMEQVGLRDRALNKNPKLLLCDEPTGALDYMTGKQILKLLQDTARSRGMTVIIITHNSALTAMADRVIRVRSGTVAEQYENEHAVPVEEIEW